MEFIFKRTSIRKHLRERDTRDESSGGEKSKYHQLLRFLTVCYTIIIDVKTIEIYIKRSSHIQLKK